METPQELQQMLQALQSLAQQTAVAAPSDEASDLSQRANALEKIFEQINALQRLIAQQNEVPPEVKLMQPGPLAKMAQLEAQRQAQMMGMGQQVSQQPQAVNQLASILV